MNRTIYVLCAIVITSCLVSISVSADNSEDIQRYIYHLNRTFPRSAQLVVVLPGKNTDTRSRLYALEKRNSTWHTVIDGVPATSGHNGFAPPGKKREGDGKTPSGIFKIAYAFGYSPSCHTGLDYRQATENDLWIDDPRSPDYNRWITGSPGNYSHEKMKRKDHLYRYGMVVEYNMDPVVKGKGSAIFIHVWRSPGKPTSGCIAVSEEIIKKLLSFLDKRKQPVVIMGLL
jgi:L,D-peptidoglycan transpeptidase YkuD (ErfK/YbiS/YcfS/YnhG family)